MAAKDSAKDPIVITGARRTPMGAFQGCLSTVAAPALGRELAWLGLGIRVRDRG